MDTSTQTVDELITALMQMGFELEDCQQAIENGKLSANDAVEWILAGKPQVKPKSSRPVLKLNPAPDVSANGLSSAALGLERNPWSCGEDPIVSRVNPSEEQRLVKLRFEEKQRVEARKEAQAEKLAKKKAHEDILRRIREDRETLKLRTDPALTPQPADGAGVAGPSSASQMTRPQRDDSACLLMIRLVDGSSVRKSFPADAPLVIVRDFVCERCSTGSAETVLIQPFPRVEFDESDMGRSLRELGLVPNGSLVVKKLDPIATQPPVESDKREADPTADAEPSKKKLASSPDHPVPMVGVQPSGSDHSWGGGQRLGDDGEEQEEEAMEDDTEEEGGADIQPVPPQIPAYQPLPPHHQPHPPGAHFLNLQNMHVVPMAFGDDDEGSHNWGAGNALVGDVLQNVSLPHHSKTPKELAAEAACRRYGTDPVPNAPSSSSTSAEVQPLAILNELPMLRDLLLHYIASQLNNPQSQIFGLHGIPENLASQILDFLVKDNRLRPAMLQSFISCRLQKVNFDSYPSCTNALVHALRHHSQLKQISLRSCPLITEKGLQSLTGLKLLRVLNLAGCSQICDGCVAIFAAMPSLTFLGLEGTSVSDAGIKEYMTSATPNLKGLDLSRTKVTEAIFVHLANAPCLASLNMEQTQVAGLSGIQRLVKLVELNISNTRIITDALLCLTNLPSLASLNCSNTPNVNGDVAVSYLAHLPLRVFHLPNRLTTTDEAIRHLTGMKLTELDLTNYIYITDASLPYIGQLTQLTVLRLCNTKITDNGMVYLQGLANLEELNLDRTAIGNAGMSIIRGLSQLRELSLSSTSVTNGFLRSGVLNSCLELTKLNLSRNTISNQGITCLHLPNLTLLNIDETYIRPETIESLRTNCPSLEKFTYRTLNTPPRDESDFD